MISFRHPAITYEFLVEPGNIVELDIENPSLYRSLVHDLGEEDEESFSLSEDGKDVEFEKKALLMRDLFDLNPNSKKILTAVYKKIEKTSLSPERQKQFDDINAKINDLVQDISTDFEGEISFNDQMALPQLLGLIDFKFNYDETTFLNAFISYLKAWREAIDLKLVFVLNLFSVLDAQEIDQLSSELSYCGISVIDIAYFPLKLSNKNVKTVIVDRDLCEIY